MAKLYNMAGMTSATTGTGTFTLGSAVSGYLTFATAGVQNGETVPYLAVEGSNWELGEGVYTSSGTTLSRATVTITSAGNTTKISFGGAQKIYISARANDLRPVECLAYVGSNLTTQNFSSLSTIPFNSERYKDVSGMHDTVTNNSRMIVPAGFTLAEMSAGVFFADISDGAAALAYIEHYNSSNVLQSSSGKPAAHGAGNAFLNWAATLYMPRTTVASGDYFVVRTQTSGDTSITVLADYTWASLKLWH